MGFHSHTLTRCFSSLFNFVLISSCSLDHLKSFFYVNNKKVTIFKNNLIGLLRLIKSF